MMNCEEIAKLVSEQKDRKLPFHRRIGMRFHLGMCKMCRLYRRQLEMLSRISSRAGEMELSASGPSGPGLSEPAKERIRKHLAHTNDDT